MNFNSEKLCLHYMLPAIRIWGSTKLGPAKIQIKDIKYELGHGSKSHETMKISNGGFFQ